MGTVSGGVGAITLPASSAAAVATGFATVRVYDLRGDAVSIKVLSTSANSTTTNTLDAAYDNGDSVSIGVNSGNIECVYATNGVLTTTGARTFDAKAHAYWRLREAGGTTFCEASPDGASWSKVGSVDASGAGLAPPSSIRVRFTAAELAGTPASGSFSFTDLNGGGPSKAAWCKATSFTDDFSGPAAPNNGWDRAVSAEPTKGDGWNQLTGRLNLLFGNDRTSHVFYTTSRAYDMTGQRVSVDAVQLVPPSEGAASIAVFNLDVSAGLYVVASVGATYCIAFPSYAIVGYMPVTPTTMSIREKGGTLSCEILTAADAGSWQTIGDNSALDAGAVVDPAAIDISLQAVASNLASGAMYGAYSVTLDNYDLPPIP